MIQFVALTGTGGGAVPFQRENANSTTASTSVRDATRLRGYEERLRFFGGVQWNFQREDGDPLVTLNYSRAVVNKVATWMVGRGLRVKVPQALQTITKPRVDELWRSAEGRVRLMEIALTAGVNGDCWILVTPKTRTPLEQVLHPNGAANIRIQVLRPHQCYPVFNPLDTDELVEFRVVAEVFDDTKNPYRVQFGPLAPAPPRSHSKRKYVQIIRADTISEGWLDDPSGWTIRENTLGEIPVVFLRNEVFPGEPYGISDLDGIIDVQRELNEKATDLSDSVCFHAAPITIITGARAKSLEKGPKALWSIPDPNAKVQNLQLGDMGPSHRYLEFTRQVLFDLSGIPEGSLGRIQSISNTSAAALQVQFQPLIEKVLRKAPLFEAAIEKINYFAIRYLQLLEGFDLPVDFCANCGGRILERPVLDRNGEQVFLRNGQPKMRRICLHADPETQEFLSPGDVKVKIKRKHSFGTELREVLFKHARRERRWMAKGEPVSYWDTDKVPEPLPETDPTTGEEREPLPPAPEKLSAKDIDLPEEPVRLRVATRVFDPTTRTWNLEDQGERLLVPTGCKQPRYLNPYETKVTFVGPLPKDRGEDTNLWKAWQQMGLVSREWIREQMDAEINSAVEDQRIADDIPFLLAMQGSGDPDPFAAGGGVAQTPGLSNGRVPPGAGVPEVPPGETGQTASPRKPSR